MRMKEWKEILEGILDGANTRSPKESTESKVEFRPEGSSPRLSGPAPAAPPASAGWLPQSKASEGNQERTAGV